MTLAALLGAAQVLLLSACGGGGGGGTEPASSATTASSTTVTPAAPAQTLDAGGNRLMTVAWTHTLQNSDGTCSSGIAAYRINLGLVSGLYAYSSLVHSSQVTCSTVVMDACGAVQRCSYTVETLRPGTWFVTVQSVDINGRESGYSEETVAVVD